MQIKKTKHLDALVDIQVTLKRQELMIAKIYRRIFPDEGRSTGGGGEGRSSH